MPHPIDSERLLVQLTVGELQAVVADAVERRLSSLASDGLIDQRTSPLGKRRHGDAVRRRIELGLPGAARVGRRWLLTPAALDEELARLSQPAKTTQPDAAEQLRAELGGAL